MSSLDAESTPIEALSILTRNPLLRAYDCTEEGYHRSLPSLRSSVIEVIERENLKHGSFLALIHRVSPKRGVWCSEWSVHRTSGTANAVLRRLALGRTPLDAVMGVADHPSMPATHTYTAARVRGALLLLPKGQKQPAP